MLQLNGGVFVSEVLQASRPIEFGLAAWPGCPLLKEKIGEIPHLLLKVGGRSLTTSSNDFAVFCIALSLITNCSPAIHYAGYHFASAERRDSTGSLSSGQTGAARHCLECPPCSK